MVIRTIFKFLLPTIVTLFLLLFYVLYTDSGQKNAYSLLSYYASKKAGLDIEIKKLNLHKYPYVQAEVLVEEIYHVDINGFIKNKKLDLQYKLNSHCLKNNVCSFDDIIDIQGKIYGWKKNFKVTGEGQALEGQIDYSFKKIKHAFRDVKLQIKDVNSTKLLTMLDQKALFHGRANAMLDFDIIEKKHRIGTLTYDVKTKNFYNLDTHFYTTVKVEDNKHTFIMDLNTSDATVHIENGTYDLANRHALANYTLDVTDISKLKKLIGGSYLGEFHAKGELEYKNKKINIKGLSHDLGGELYFVYDSKILELMLKNVSFETLMQRLKIKPILQANITGVGTYNIKKKEMKLETKLQKTKLLPSSITRSIQKKFNFNLENEIFDQSSFELNYKNKHVVSSNFILANNNAYLKLKNTKINASHNAINTYIDLKTPKHALAGKLFARLDDIGEKSLDEIYIKYNGTIEKYYHIKVDGFLSDDFVNMDYTLHAARLPSKVCTIVDDINISGHASGAFERLHILANGTAMEGKVQFNAIKMKEHYENISFILKDIHTLKLFTLLGLPDFPSGKADINAKFNYFSNSKKSGTLHYILHKGKYQTLPLSLEINAKVNKNNITFQSRAKLATADINISKGSYDLDNNTSKAFYTLYTKDLLPLEPLIGRYQGAFSSTGEINYKDSIQIRGLSSSFGGIIDFLYKKDMLYIDLEDVFLKQFMGLFPYPQFLDASIKGSINYDYTKEKLLIETELLNTKFLNSDLVQTVFDKSGVDMLKERFPQSTLRATYQNKVLTGDLMLKGKQSHFYLTSVRIDKNTNNVNGFFDLKMQGQAFSGKVNGDLKHPKIDLNMQKLIRYQMDKQLDSVIGKGNRKLMESMPMGDVAKDVASGMGGGFLDMFF